jgi:hypothetical protein
VHQVAPVPVAPFRDAPLAGRQQHSALFGQQSQGLHHVGLCGAMEQGQPCWIEFSPRRQVSASDSSQYRERQIVRAALPG